MIYLKKHNINIIVTVFTVTMFFSCKNNFKEVQQIGILQNEPIGVADSIDVKYTEKLIDTAKVKANLLSPKMLDFSNRDFPYSEFPDGIYLIVYDKDQNKTIITADYAIYYTQTDLIDLQGHVILATHNKDTLFADQLYYDQKREWVFSNKPFKFVSTSYNSKGNIFDSDTEFKNLQTAESSGDVFIAE